MGLRRRRSSDGERAGFESFELCRDALGCFEVGDCRIAGAGAGLKRLHFSRQCEHARVNVNHALKPSGLSSAHLGIRPAQFQNRVAEALAL